MLTAALAYATRLGWPMLAVSRTKGPLCAHGVHSATTDQKALAEMWAREPGANLAVRCEKFFVVDIDPRNGGHVLLNRWGEEHGDFPTTWEAATGSGGTHFYFEHDPALDAIPLGGLDGGIDIKGGGRHYVLVPPSRSKSGPYRWIVRPSACALAKAPRWLVDLIVRKKTRTAAPTAPPVDPSRYAGVDRVERARRYARKLPAAISGSGGHDTTIRVACLVTRGFWLSEDEAFVVLSEWNRTCEPPWSENELRRKIRQTLEGGSMPLGALLERGGRAA